MSNVSLVGMAQVTTLMISIAEVLFFGHTLCSSNNPNPIWEPLWVTMVECICYAIQIASNSHRFEMADGAKINVISPMAWMLACPVAMSFMMRISWPEVSPRVNIALIMNLEAVILCGLVSAMTNNWSVKLPLFGLAVVLYIILCSFLFRGMFFTKINRPREAKNIFLFFMVTWLLFPTVWILGPNMTGAWSYERTLLFFAFGDLFSKNIFTYIGYKYTMSIDENTDSVDSSMVKPQLSSLQLTTIIPEKDVQQEAPLDPFLIASIVKNLEEGAIRRSGSGIRGVPETRQRLSQMNSHMSSNYGNDTYGYKASSHEDNKLNRSQLFPTEFYQDACMTGTTKDTKQEINFVVLNSTTEKNVFNGSSIEHIEAQNEKDENKLHFTVMRNKDDIFCDLFCRIKCRQPMLTNIADTTTSINSRTPERYHQVPLVISAATVPSPSFINPIGYPVQFSFNADVKSNNETVPFVTGTELFAWKNGTPRKIHVKSSKIISLDNHSNGGKQEAYVIVSVGGDVIIILTTEDKNGKKLILESKFDNLTYTKIENDGQEASQLNDLFPALKRGSPQLLNELRHDATSYGA